ncbi:uncharacterized protein [Amphiura filiformis]|uniref:uncharacterized protein n=1 Tax=Amphiura filiformis TaxID=82378 RepID=UPI003B217D9F
MHFHPPGQKELNGSITERQCRLNFKPSSTQSIKGADELPIACITVSNLMHFQHLKMLYHIFIFVLGFSTINCQEPDIDYSDNDAKILILGGGRGGLHAAEILLDNEITDFIILEGESEPGGLEKLINFDGIQLESGFQWAYPPLKSTLDDLNIQYHESNYDSYVVRNDLGQVVTKAFNEGFDRYYAAKEVVDEIARDSLKGKRLDVAQKVGLYVGGLKGYEPIEGAVEWYEIEFEYGKPSKDISIVGPYEQDFGSESQYYITDRNKGLFGRALEALDSDHLRLNKLVRNVNQTEERVVVTTADGSQYTADYVLVTFSIGVLQRGNVTFTRNFRRGRRNRSAASNGAPWIQSS